MYSSNPYISLEFTTGKTSLRDIRSFLPDKLIPKKVLSFLTGPGIQGLLRVEEARLEGPWANLTPEGLRKHPEMLSVRVQLDKWSLRVDSKLPPLRNISGVLTLRGDQAGIEAFHGRFLRARFFELNGSISRVYSDPRMALTFKGDLDFKGLLSNLKAKGMSKEVRKALDPIVKLSGKAKMAGEIRYVFSKPADLTYKGRITLKRTRLGIAGFALPLTNLEGEIRYDEKEIVLSKFKWRMGKNLCQGNASFRGYLRRVKKKLTISRKMRISLDIGAQEIRFDALFSKGETTGKIQIDPKSIWVNSTFTGKVRISKGSFRGFRLGNLKTTFSVKRGILRFKNFQAETPGGFIRFRGWINLKRRGGISFKLIPQIHHLNMTKVTPIFLDHGKGPSISGALDLDGIIAGSGNSLDSITKSLRGDLRLRVAKGRIQGLETSKGDGLPYNQATAQITIQRGVASTRDLLLDSDAISMAIKGQANLNNQILDISIGVRPLQTVDKILSNVPLAGWLLAGKDRSILTFGYRVRGKFNDLRVEARQTRMKNP